jgi:hypothetical protein
MSNWDEIREMSDARLYKEWQESKSQDWDQRVDELLLEIAKRWEERVEAMTAEE